MNSDTRRKILLRIARDSIGEELGIGKCVVPDSKWLQEYGATFVTLHIDGHLRGCIGSIEAHRPLGEDVAKNAAAAAFEDSRFPPLKGAEYDELNIEVSVLSPLVPLKFKNEEDALAQLRPGVDGVVIEYSYHRATYLPQVWEKIPDRHHFMADLKHKAGLPADFWDDRIKISTYTLMKYQEGEKE